MIHYSKKLWDQDGKSFRPGYFVEEAGRITELRFANPPSHQKVKDWGELCVGPAFVDLHVHARDFDESRKETLESVDRAAQKGGVAVAACLANTRPRLDTVDRVKAFLERAKTCRTRLIPFAAVTKNLEGQEDTDWKELQRLPIAGFSDDGRPIDNADRMKRLMKFCSGSNLLISLHEEDLHLSKGSCLHDGPAAVRRGVWGSPAQAEVNLVERDLKLLREIHTPLHFAHMSSKEAVSLLTRTKRDGLKFSAELTPHHALLEASEADRFSVDRLAHFKVCPPVREAADREALLMALREGVINCIATDHAPHSGFEKSLPIEVAAPGYSSLEYFFTLANEIRIQADLSWQVFFERTSLVPATLLRVGEEWGSLSVGRRASFVVFDPEVEVSLDLLASKSQNGPWNGRKLRGKLLSTWMDGQEAYSS